MEKYHFTDSERNIMERFRVPFAVYQFVDRRVVPLVLSDGFLDLFGYETREAGLYDMEHDMYKYVHPDDAARVADESSRFAVEDGVFEAVYRIRKTSGGSYFLVHSRGEHYYTGDGVRLAQVWYTDEGSGDKVLSASETGFDAVSDRKSQEDAFKKASYYDYLTGLPTMSYFFELAEAGREGIERDGGHTVILYIDISGMMYYNRKHGFAQGDELLKDLSRLLADYFSNENCSRFSSDHFAVFTDGRGVEEILGQLFKDFGEMVPDGRLPLRVGIYRLTDDSVSVSAACDRAKDACNALRHTLVSSYNFYESSMQEEADKRLYIINNIDRAIQEKWITVYYQPIVRAVNGRVCDEEALARWIDPERGFLSPADFIPVLEDTMLTYKLDLYVLEQVLEKLHDLEKEGLTLVPQSINLSRADFDSCDIVDEIRKRVDASGIDRSLITIEITESVIGRDFEFMKAQVERFTSMGFPVWMDDFGSGYSSLDLLQSLHFDLIKFDMQFMRQYEESPKSQVMLTELMKMATVMKIDTVCEGVETEKQVQFLREIGCSKLQGYYYAKPIPLEQIKERYKKGIQIGFENPAESRYFETVGRLDLYDLTVISYEDEDRFDNLYNTIPMAITEVDVDKRTARIVRSNQSYRSFYIRNMAPDKLPEDVDFSSIPVKLASSHMDVLCECSIHGNRAFFDEKMADGTTVHSFIRRIAVNPVTGTAAIAVAILVIMQDNEKAIYQSIARALAADYFNIFYVDLKTEEFIEYTSHAGEENLQTERYGKDFFARSREDARKLLHIDDQEKFVKTFTKENVVNLIDTQGAFNLLYRLAGDPDEGVGSLYVNMKATRMRGDDRHIAIGVRNVDTQMRQKEALESLKRDQVLYERMNALAGNYFCMYTVDPETGHFVEYSSSDNYLEFGIAKEGEDFFVKSQRKGAHFIHPDDQPAFRRCFSLDYILAEIDKRGIFVFSYRLCMNGEYVQIESRAVLRKENGSARLIVGLKYVDEYVD